MTITAATTWTFNPRLAPSYTNEATTNTVTLQITTDVRPYWLLNPPRKARNLTGKAYRAARRAHARRVKAWRRAGSPMGQRLIYIPNARVTIQGTDGSPHE